MAGMGGSKLLKLLAMIWLVPLILAGATAFQAWQVIDARSKLVETTGTVVKVYEWENDNPFDSSAFVYGPVFRYTWSDGTETEASTGMSSSEYNFPIGAKMTIRYDRLSRGNVVIAGPGEWFFVRIATWALVVACLLAFVLSGLVWRRSRKGASV